MFKITFQMENGDTVHVDANQGEKLLDVAKKANVVIDAPCSGNGSCGKCKIKLLEGELDSQKTRHITEEEYQEGIRLACVSQPTGDVVVEVPDIASAFKSRMKVADLSSPEEIKIFNKTKEDVQATGLTFENNMSIIPLSLDAPTLDDTMPDNERLIRAIMAAEGAETVRLSAFVVTKLAGVLREHKFQVQCVIEKNEEGILVYDVLGDQEEALIGGLVVDIGTTTVSGLITDLRDGRIVAKSSAGNGQIRYGADVINRIIESTKPDGKKKLQDAIIVETLNPLIEVMCQSAGIPGTALYRITIASNTTMNHLLIGVDSESIRMEPYIPTFFKTDSFEARDLNLKTNPHARILFAPNIGSYVGGDITAGVLANTMWNKPELALFVDLGTNGEIVFGNEDFLMGCACSAGPAFEGGDISCGMRATDGAIESCTIDSDTMEPTFKVIADASPIGLCGSGIIDVISELFRCGIINPKGLFVRDGKRVKRDEFGMGSYVLAFKEDAGTIKDVEITEVDIDNFIRAKGAIFSAIKLMLESLDFDVSMLEKVYVAGGIGSGISMENAVNIGMFPNIPLEKYEYIGNSSLSGAYTMIMSSGALEKLDELGSSITYMELSTNPRYMDEFVAACFIPHTDASLFQ